MPDGPGSDGIEARIARLEDRLRELEERTGPPAARPPARADDAAPGDLELRLGSDWLGRLGIVALITGVALLVIYRFGELGVALRICVGYGAGAALGLAGRWLTRRHRLVGHLLVGGGLAVAYFVTYALHFIAAVRVVESRSVALALVAAAIVAVVWIAHRMRSETVAGIALFLCLHTALLSAITSFTLVATCLLAAGAVFFLVANRWVVVPGSGLVAAYATHARWMLAGSEGGSHALSIGLLGVYFLLFSAGVLLRPGALGLGARVLLTVGNGLGLLVLGGIELRASPGGPFALFLAVAAIELGLAAVARARGRDATEVADVHLGGAAAAAALAAWSRLDPALFGIAIAAVAVALDGAACLRRAPALGWVSVGVLAAALLRPPVVDPEPLRLAAVAVAALAGGELLRRGADASPVRAWALDAHAALAAAALLRLGSAAAPEGWGTLAWAVAATLLFGAGFVGRARRYRIAGFAAFAATGARLLLLDLRRLGPDLRIATFLALGVLLLTVSYAYGRRRAS